MQDNIILGTPYVPFQYSLKNIKLYLFVFAFTIGNVLLPMAIHTIPDGGKIFQPLLFFTLVAAYSEGFLAGVMVAIASPFFNYFLTGMPVLEMIPAVLFKSLLVACLAAYISIHLRKINVIAIGLILIVMQVLGGIFDYFISGCNARAFHYMIIGFPGLIVMLAGGYAMLRFIASIRKERA